MSCDPCSCITAAGPIVPISPPIPAIAGPEPGITMPDV